MTDTTNTEPPLLPEPKLTLRDGVPACYYTAVQCEAYGDARAAHAVAQMQVEPVAWLYDTDMADLAAGKNARVYPVDAKPHYKDTDRVVRLYTAPATAEQPQAREITDAEIDALVCDELGFVSRDPHYSEVFKRIELIRIVRAAIALANGRGGS